MSRVKLRILKPKLIHILNKHFICLSLLFKFHIFIFFFQCIIEVNSIINYPHSIDSLRVDADHEYYIF